MGASLLCEAYLELHNEVGPHKENGSAHIEQNR